MPAAEHCAPKNAYKPTANQGKRHAAIGVTQANYNGTSRNMSSWFKAKVGGEVKLTHSGELKTSASVVVAELEAHLQQLPDVGQEHGDDPDALARGVEHMGELSTTHRRRGAARFLAAGCAVAALLATIGCSTDGEADPGGTEPSGSASRVQTETPDKPARDSVDVAPRLPDGDAVATEANVTGSRQVPLEGGVKKGPLGIMVKCLGQGTLKVTFEPAGLAFPLECGAGEVSATYNQIVLKQDRSSAHIQVTAPGSVRWAMTVGQ
ncbi:hypothetical protein [Streptomyces sp. NPDC007355]|uniref:hypothetical protein n=1 Tax=Streptomyces sp. NPDC007355 TaxID=3364778 RepID=UPI0036CAC9A5